MLEVEGARAPVPHSRRRHCIFFASTLHEQRRNLLTTFYVVDAILWGN